MNQLEKYGLHPRFVAESTLYPQYVLGRIVAQYGQLYKVITEDSEFLAEVSGKYRHHAQSTYDFPAVGDFAMLDRANSSGGNGIIHQILTRKSCFCRKAAGTKNELQIVAANIDIVFICMSLNQDFNLRRLERYLSVAWESGATPVVVLTKSDLCNNTEELLAQVQGVAIGVDILITSGFSTQSCDKLRKYIKPETTASFIGSSGVGKSTLINILAGESLQETNGLRNDDKGRHTTTRREIIPLNTGGALVDTPGMRELGVEYVDLSKSFEDIDELALSCKFNDCTHTKEPGCAILKAIEEGSLDNARFLNYLKLKKEASYDGLSSKQIETQKFNSMFAEYGGMKNARKVAKEFKQHKG